MTNLSLPPPGTPLYNHPLPYIEQWLQKQGCEQDKEDLHCWQVERATWKAKLWLDVEELTVRYLNAGENGQDIQRAFKYSLSRQDVEDAIFAGP
jgi:hypothetical protein